MTALIGPSGCGKSTFLRILNRMHESVPVGASSAGEVLLNGEDIYAPGLVTRDPGARRIGMVFQKPNPFPAMSIADNVDRRAEADRHEGQPLGANGSRSSGALLRAGLWDEVKDRLTRPASALSGGQQQRLCIARSLAVEPDVLLMDEPCSALDPTSTRRIEETIAELRDEVTIVIVTHNMQQAARVSQQCAFFLAEQGTPGRIVESRRDRADLRRPARPAHRRLRQRAVRLTMTAPPPTLSTAVAVRPAGRAADHRPGPRAQSTTSSTAWPRAIGLFVLVMTGAIGLFLGYQIDPDAAPLRAALLHRERSGIPSPTRSASPRSSSARSRSRSSRWSSPSRWRC